jgi:7-cyano-7-deazaguanine synthase in queuosine biosynthesis
MTAEALFTCDGARPSAALTGQSWTNWKSINAVGPQKTMTLTAESLASKVLSGFESRAADLVRIASYVYAADQELSRGGERDVYGRAWRRHLVLCIPVTEPALWMQDEVRTRLVETLYFLTEDRWDFEFSQAPAPLGQLPLMVDPEAVLQHPDSVILLSGGADSLCAAVEAMVLKKARPVIVSHRPTPPTESRQKALVESLQRRVPGWTIPHLSFCIHRMGSDAADNAQRSRAFLFASLGAAVASELGLRRVLLADNGIVSLNLSLNGSLIGALASRTTHPKFIHLFNRFVAAALAGPVQVANPLSVRTRAETLTILKAAGCESLLQETLSCGRWRGLPKVTPQCGYCSQCVDRRFGAITAGLEEHDLAERYRVDIFRHALPAGERRTIPESFVRLARDIYRASADALFSDYPQLYECLVPDDPAADQTAQKLVDLLKRQATSTLDVIASVLARYRQDLANGELPDTCLLRLVVGPSSAPEIGPRESDHVFLRKGSVWMLTYAGQTEHINQSRGLQYLVHLLRAPDKEIHCVTLALAVVGATPAAGDDVGRTVDPELLASAGMHLGDQTDDDVIDAKALRAYRDHVQDLERQAEEAVEAGDRDRADAIREEVEHFIWFVKDARGLGGHARKFKNDAERTRQRVSIAIRRSIRDISKIHSALALHLRATIMTGTYCSYRPNPPITWRT